MTVGDVYYILFRHKGKIGAFLCAAVAGLVIVKLFSPPVYQSEAKLLIRYVLESKALNPGVNDSGVKSPDRGGENIINSELEILTSLDLAQQVAETVGPEKIL